MLRLRKIAIIGDIAAGKSSVCSIWQELGAYVLRADDIVHELYSKPTEQLLSSLAQIFGEEVFTNKDSLRELLREKILKQGSLLQAIEQIVHPYIKEAILDHFLKAERLSYRWFVVELPIIQKLEMEKWFDDIICVNAPLEERNKRLSEEQSALKDLFPSPSISCTATIQNSGTKLQLKEQVLTMIKTLRL